MGIVVLGSHSGNYLAQKVMNHHSEMSLDLKQVIVNSQKFANGEIGITLGNNIRQDDIFLFATGLNEVITKDDDSTIDKWSVNDHIMELLAILDCCRRSEAQKITLIIPFFPYLRQDKRMTREPITASLLCAIIESKIDRIITLDAHFEQFPGLFREKYVVNMPTLNFFSSFLEKRYGSWNNSLKRFFINPEQYILVSADTGGKKRIEKYAERLCLPHAEMTKNRDYTQKNVVVDTTLYYSGDIEGKTAIIIDDMIDTGGTIISACKTLVNKGIRECILIATHGLFNKKGESFAMQKIDRCDAISEVIVTNSLPQDQWEGMSEKLKVVDISSHITRLLFHSETGGSVTKFLNDKHIDF